VSTNQGEVPVLVGAEPPSWLPQTWRYQDLTFVADDMLAADLAAALVPDGTITLGGLTARSRTASDRAYGTHQPSHGRYGQPSLPVPTYDFTLHWADRGTTSQLPNEMLVGTDCPSFPSPDHAWRAFFHGDFSASSPSGSRSELGLIRLAATEAWLGPVRVSPTELAIEVMGHDVAGARLELFGAADRSEREITAAGTTVFPLPDGLPENAWLWLKRDTDWLDYRAFTPQWTPPGDLAAANVTFDVPVDPAATLDALLSSGEGPDVEFKSAIPESKPEPRRKVFKTVAAFATGGGGTMVFGMDPDELTVCGLGSEDPKNLRDRLGNLIRESVIPTPNFSIDTHTVDGKALLVLTVQKSPSPPYAIVVDPGSRNKPEYYVRRGASTYYAQPSDLREALASE
jgi:Putative DNA-binding domain